MRTLVDLDQFCTAGRGHYCTAHCGILQKKWARARQRTQSRNKETVMFDHSTWMFGGWLTMLIVWLVPFLLLFWS